MKPTTDRPDATRFAACLAELPSTVNASGRIVYSIDQDLLLIWLNRNRGPRIAIAEATRRIGVSVVDKEFSSGPETEPPYFLSWPNPDYSATNDIIYWDDLDLLQFMLFDEQALYSFAEASKRFEIIVSKFWGETLHKDEGV